MDIETYQNEGRTLYAAWAEAVAGILKSALETESGMQLQQIQHRAKDVDSLRRKLERDGQRLSVAVEEIVKDLAGCRLVFYTNSDIERFTHSLVLENNFSIDRDRSKIHYPSGEDSDLFISENWVVHLNEQRASLPEYARFTGLRCEVQIQTILNHAWSEMAHDTIYKPINESGFGSALITGMRQRLARVMREHLLLAGYEFQKVASDYQRLLQGKSMFDYGALERISQCSDRNLLHEQLERFAHYVLPNYDDLLIVFPDISNTLTDAAVRAITMPDLPHITPWGEFPGTKPEEVISDVCNVFRSALYIDPESTFDCALTIYASAQDDEQRKPIEELIRRLTQHNRDAWQHGGPFVQKVIVAKISAMRDDAASDAATLIVTALREVLSTTMTGQTHEADAIVLHSASVPLTDELADLRRHAISQLCRLYRLVADSDGADAVLRALAATALTPRHSAYTSELSLMIMQDLVKVVHFYVDIVGDMELERRRKLEVQLFDHYLRFSHLPPGMLDGCELVSVHSELMANIQECRASLDFDPDYQSYKTLVGHDSVTSDMWKEGSYRDRTHSRSAAVEALARGVDAENSDAWLERVKRYVRTENVDLATFTEMSVFLQKIATYNPDVLIGWLSCLSDRLSDWLPPMLNGLVDAARSDSVNELIERWILEERYLSSLAWYLGTAKSFNEAALVRIVERAVTLGDVRALGNAAIAAILQFKNHPGRLVDDVLLPSADALVTMSDFRWLGTGVFTWREQPILHNLEERQARHLLDLINDLPSLDWNGEELLAGIARAWPDLALDFIGSRFTHDKKDSLQSFEAIPYKLDELREPLAVSPNRLISAARTWFDRDRRLFEYKGGRIVAEVFPNFEETIKTRLQQELANRSRDSAEFVLAVIRAYDGRKELHPVLQDIVEMLDSDDELLEVVKIVIRSSGVLLGDHGSAEAIAARVEIMGFWTEDSREKVRVFAANFIRVLEQSRRLEVRKADQAVAFRRLCWE